MVFSRFLAIRKLSFLSFFFVTTTMLIACQETTDLISTSRPDNIKAVSVALLVPKGSNKSGDDVIAESLENSAQLAILESAARGIQITLNVYPTERNPEITKLQAIKAIENGAQVILGPVFTETTRAASLALSSSNVNILSFSNNANVAGGNVFILGPTFPNTANRLTAYANSQGKRNIVIIHENSVAGQAGHHAIDTAAGSAGVNIVGSVTYQQTQTSVISAVSEIEKVTTITNADVLFLTSTSSGALPLFAQLLPEVGVTSANVQYIGLTRWDIPVQTLALSGIQHGWFALPDPIFATNFQARYHDKFGISPHPIGSLAYDGITAIHSLLESGANPRSKAALTQSAGFQGATGLFRLLKDGTNERSLAVATVQDKQVQVIDPAPRFFSNFDS
ncbi:MAG: penicillin-binding protein activator [Aestuariivita sp.]|nr:penicillin-binding protein activator [Aestuariivita sp.]